MLCHKCHQATPAEGDSWCLGCAGWEALGRELCSPWPSEGARRLAADLVISRARQVRGLRNFAQAVRSNQASSQAAARKREADENQEDQIDLSSRGASLQLLTHRCWEQRQRGHKEETSSGHFSEESEVEEELPDQVVTPLGGKGHRRPPEPDGPPPKRKKEGHGRKDQHRGHRERQPHHKGHTTSHKGAKPRHRAGRKHQRLGRLEFDSTVKVHRKLSSHFLDTLSLDKGHDSFNRLP